MCLGFTLGGEVPGGLGACNLEAPEGGQSSDGGIE